MENDTMTSLSHRTNRSMNAVAALLLGAVMVASGCKHAATPAPGVRNSDGSITNADGSITYPAGSLPSAPPPAPVATVNPDGSTTNPDGSVTYPAGSTRAKTASQTPAPVQTAAPAPAPVQQSAPPPQPAPAPVARVVPSGTPVHVSITQELSASRNEVGDSFSGVLSEAIVSRGSTIFQRGTPVSGRVAASKRKGRFKGAGDLAIEITAIGREHVSTTEYEAVAKGQGKRTAGLIGGGGGLGALIGGIAGGGKGALIGGLAGAGAGTAGAAYTGNRDVIIRPETQITFRLTAPITLR
jgi:hypothetical protein